jgi:hypothetical protein
VDVRPGAEFHRVNTVTGPRDQEKAVDSARNGQSGAEGAGAEDAGAAEAGARGAASERAAVEPMETNDVLIVGIGTALFAVASVVLLPMHASLERSGHGRWPWIALSGVVLGLLGLFYCRRRAQRVDKPNGQ